MRGIKISQQEIAGLIDHTRLKPDTTEKDIIKLCNEARKYNFCAVCINPAYVKLATDLLISSGIKVATVIGFPLGATLKNVRIYEAIESVSRGADELDIVISIGLAKEHKWDVLQREISEIIRATRGTVHKFIIETALLSEYEIKTASSLIRDSGAEYIKTSTGFGPAGARIRDVRIIKSVAGNKTGIKAAGGIKKLEDVLAFIKAGATRIGTSSGVDIIEEIKVA